VLIELFSLGRTAEALRAIIGSNSAISLQRGAVDPKFQVEGVAPTNHASSQKTRLNYLSHAINIWTDFSSVLSQCTRLTDRRTVFSSLDRVCIPCSAVKIMYMVRFITTSLALFCCASHLFIQRPLVLYFTVSTTAVSTVFITTIKSIKLTEHREVEIHRLD